MTTPPATGVALLPEISRRSFLRRGLLAATALASAPSLMARGALEEAEATAAERGQIRAEAMAFLARHGVPGMQVAFARHGRMVYAEAFGFADDEGQAVGLSPSNLFRIASVTKPITSVAILALVERGRLLLAEPVFGPSGVLGDDFGRPRTTRFFEDLKVEHLLTHTAGGWPNDGTDPMFRDPKIPQADLIAWAIRELPLEYPPGQHYAYSNFGYCLLGRVIEKRAGRPYARFVAEEVLARCGVTDMRIAGSTRAERAKGEVFYRGQGEDPYAMNVQRMDSHGGWLATASDLVRFATRVDGFSRERNILRPDTIRLMTTASQANSGYAKGWAVNPSNNWWHTGSLPGTTAILVRTASGLCWAGLANTRGKNIELGLDEALWRMARSVPAWRA